MKTRYNWEGEPEWVKFKATDRSGMQFRFEYLPEKSNCGTRWTHKSGRCKLVHCNDWADSLEARPEPEAKPEPVKYDPAKLKPFDLERALAGEPVCTVEGIPVSQVTRFETLDDFTLYGVVDDTVLPWRDDGTCGVSTHDLRMAPKTRTVYVNFYEGGITDGWHENIGEALALAGDNCIARAVPVEIEE